MAFISFFEFLLSASQPFQVDLHPTVLAAAVRTTMYNPPTNLEALGRDGYRGVPSVPVRPLQWCPHIDWVTDWRCR